MFFAISNLSSAKVSEVKPWDFKRAVPSFAQENKAKFVAWCQKPTTQNCHYSGFEGLDPLRRVSGDNEPVKLHGLIADYDAKITPEMLANVKEECPTEFIPNWGSMTFSSGGRLVWEFEAPVTLGDAKVTQTFLKLAAKKLKLIKLLPGLDESAFLDLNKYYECGTEWTHLSSDPIPSNFVHQWLFEAGNKVRWNTNDAVIPLDIVFTEIERQFPNRWPGGNFDEGTRCPRFWEAEYNPDTYDKTGVVVRASGMQCFSGDAGFISWGELLGRKFVEKYEADRTGEILTNLFYDGKNYWRKDVSGYWIPVPKEDFRLMLKVKYGLSNFCTRRETCSEVDKVMYAVQEQKAVTAALPFVHFPSGLLRKDGQNYLNTSNVECMKPAECTGEWGKDFPWLSSFIDTFFDPADQKEFFLGWWKHFYENALAKTPRAGQALFVAGDPGVGKTLLSTAIVSASVGGHVDASSYLLGEEKFTSHVVGSPIMSVDDTVPASDTRRHTRYSAMIKKITANRYHTYEEKFQKAGQVTWLGRVVVTCNLDPESVRLLPNVELSLLDKINLFKCAKVERKFPSPTDLMKIINAELPYLLRWLLDWEIPDHCKGDSRFGVASYHETHLFNSALQTSASYTFLELLTDFLSAYSESAGDKTEWVGNSTQLLADMSIDPRIGGIACRLRPTQIASYLGQLSARGYSIESARLSTSRTWHIPFDLVNEVTAKEEEMYRKIMGKEDKKDEQ